MMPGTTRSYSPKGTNIIAKLALEEIATFPESQRADIAKAVAAKLKEAVPGLKAAGKGKPKGSKKQSPAAGKGGPKKAAARRASTRRAAGTRGPGRPRKTAPAVVQQPQDDASAVA